MAGTIRKQPLWRLQNVGNRRLEFIYDHDLGQGSEVWLKEGVCFCFRAFHGLVHELITGAWLRFVRNIGENAPLLGETSDLSEFMFGSGRAPRDVYRPILAEYQRGLLLLRKAAQGSRGGRPLHPLAPIPRRLRA